MGTRLNSRPFVLAIFLFLTFQGQGQAQDAVTGMASYYHDSLEGKPTASGEPYKASAMTAAHPSLPFNTQLKVTNLGNGRSVIVRVNDRGPFAKNRILDVSRAAAKELDFLDKGVARVQIEILHESPD